jgi:glutamate-1-semialdehyde 2,1-aminomutase
MTRTSPAAGRNFDRDSALEDADASYSAAHPRSLERHRGALAALPGGNTRSILHYAPFPLTALRGEGCRIWSLDGQEFIDFLCEYSAGLYGHSHPVIRQAVEEALAEGVVLGAPNRDEADFAALLCARFPSIEHLRFCNSGSEATLMCLSLARALSGRQKVLAFRGAYHGGFLVFADGPAPLNAPFEFVMADYNNLEGTRALLREKGDDIAAVIVEPMLGAGGCLPADRTFLEMLHEESRAVGALLIFDEVITSRLSPGGLQAVTEVTPDLTALGKYLGGGLSFGAFGGSETVMARFDPARPDALMHAGTFNNNVLTMAAGKAGLDQVLTPRAITDLNQRGERLRERLASLFEARDVAMTVSGLGSLITIHFLSETPTRPADLKAQDPRLKRLFHLTMLERGIYLSPRGMLALSLPMKEAETDALLAAVESFIDTYGALV